MLDNKIKDVIAVMVSNFTFYFEHITIYSSYLRVSDKSRDAAAYMLSRFMTRHDVKAKQLPQFIDWALVTVKNADTKYAIKFITFSIFFFFYIVNDSFLYRDPVLFFLNG